MLLLSAVISSAAIRSGTSVPLKHSEEHIIFCRLVAQASSMVRACTVPVIKLCEWNESPVTRVS